MSNRKSARSARALAVPALLLAGGAGCLDGLDPPFAASSAEIGCSDDPNDRYLSTAGTMSNAGVVLFDGHPPAASPVIQEDDGEPGFVLSGSAEEGEYRFFVLNTPAIQEGSADVVRSSTRDPHGIRLVLELKRLALGAVELNSIHGEITFFTVASDELAGRFAASFGQMNDEFEGCFHVDLVRAEAAQ